MTLSLTESHSGKRSAPFLIAFINSGLSYLYDNPHFLLQQEVREVGSYFSITKQLSFSSESASVSSAVTSPSFSGRIQPQGVEIFSNAS